MQFEIYIIDLYVLLLNESHADSALNAFICVFVGLIPCCLGKLNKWNLVVQLQSDCIIRISIKPSLTSQDYALGSLSSARANSASLAVNSARRSGVRAI